MSGYTEYISHECLFSEYVRVHDNEIKALTPSTAMTSKPLSPILAQPFIIIHSYRGSLWGSFQGQVIFKQTGQDALWLVSIHLTQPPK